MRDLQDEQPVAGPSSRPWVADPEWRSWHYEASSNQYARKDLVWEDRAGALRRRRTRKKDLDRRQDVPTPTAPEPSPSASQPAEQPSDTGFSTPGTEPVTSAPASTTAPFESTSEASYSIASSSSPPPLFSGPRNEASDISASSSPTQPPSASSPVYTSSSLPWSTRTGSSAAAPTPTFVPGVTLNMTLGGDSDTEAIYAVPVELGHVSNAPDRRKRAPGDEGDAFSQVMNVQLDLGSSDMVRHVYTSFESLVHGLTGFKMLFDDSQSLDSGVSANFTYQSGSVSGDIYWEQLTLGAFQIGYQAFISATVVENQDLINGNFTGVLGLAFPAASTIQTKIPGTTGSNPDGATFLDNLFGSGAYAPTKRMFSMALERREDVRTRSIFTIGETSDRLCPKPCSPNELAVIAHSSLGATGFVHWRVSLVGITATTWNDPENGEGPSDVTIPLGPSFAETSRTSPLAVLDSGGVQILVSRRSYADSIYSAFGASVSGDGLYRMPCKTQMALSFDFGGIEVPVHPLDMTYPDPSDPSQTSCIGMVQVADNLGDVGDFILGSSFLKNVYAVYNYPDQVRSTRWQPTVGLVPLTNASSASRDFYAVRTNRQSLRSVSSDESRASEPDPWHPDASATPSSSGGKKVTNTAVIIACSVVGFFVLAAAAFCAWWFWLRRKFGAAGVVEYKRRSKSDGHSSHHSDYSGSTLRAKKHEGTMRQKSLIEGYADYEGDSWVSETGDSIRLGHIPEVAEDGDDESKARPVASSQSEMEGDHTPKAHRILEDSALLDEPAALPTLLQDDTPTKRRGSSPHPRLSLAAQEARSSYSQAGPYPTMSKSNTSRSLSVSMSGPFPSGHLARQSALRPDASPMYDINTSDYFQVPNRGRDPRRGSRSRERDHTPSGGAANGTGAGLNPANPFDTP